MSRWIDADAVIAKLDEQIQMPTFMDCLSAINSEPSMDIVPCQDCKYWVSNFHGCSRNACAKPWYADDFCSYGEREGE